MNTKKILLTGIFTILIFSKPSFTMDNCQNKVKECPICYEDKNSKDLHKMSCCDMTFCKKCHQLKKNMLYNPTVHPDLI